MCVSSDCLKYNKPALLSDMTAVYMRNRDIYFSWFIIFCFIHLSTNALICFYISTVVTC